MTDDWECLKRARAGDDDSWRILFTRHYPLLVRMTSFITGSLDSAQDIAQEAFVKLLKADIRHQNGSFKSLLSTIAYRLALKERKHSTETHKAVTDNIVDDSQSWLEAAIQDETERIIASTIHSLSPEHREVLTLKYFGGHTYEEITVMAGIPLGTVKSRIFYAIKCCQEELKKQGVFK